MDSSAYIRWEVEGCAGILTLDNPPGNEMEVPDFLSPQQLLDWTCDPRVKGMIIRGAGRHFSSGADLENLYRTAEDGRQLQCKMDAGKKMLDTLENLDIPVIAAISGICFGGGLELALACHFRICAAQSLFAFPEVNHNLIPGLGGTLRLSALIGKSKALAYLLTGDTVDAETAIGIGLADQVCSRDALTKTSGDLVNRLVKDKPKKVVSGLIRAWNNSRTLSAEEALAAETRIFCELARDEYLRRKNQTSA